MKSRLDVMIADFERERDVIDLSIAKLKTLRDTTPAPRLPKPRLVEHSL